MRQADRGHKYSMQDRRITAMQSKAVLMCRLRKQRKDAGLIKLELWLTPEQRQLVINYIESIKRG